MYVPKSWLGSLEFICCSLFILLNFSFKAIFCDCSISRDVITVPGWVNFALCICVFISHYRHKNYLVAMVNKSILPLKFNLPFLGETVFLTRSLKYNIEFILFWGPWAPFDSSWHLREEFKRVSRRREHAQRLAKYIMFLGLFIFFCVCV